MNPMQMARNECANHMGFRGTECNNEHPCRLTEKRRCGYFEKSVMPLALARPDEFGDVAMAYQQMTEAPKADLGQLKHTARECGCGEPLRPRRRLCDTCAARKRQLSKKRQNDKKKHVEVVQLRPNSTL